MANGGPVLPVLKVVGGLLGLLGWLFFLGLQRVWRNTFGWLFATLADLLDVVHIPIPHFADPHPFGNVAAWLRSLNRNVSTALAVAADASEHLAVWLFSRVRLAFSWIGREIEHLAADVLALGLRIVRVYVPNLVRRLLRFVWKELRALGRYARKMIPKLARQLFRFSKWAAHRIAAAARHVGFLWKWAKAVIRLHWRAIRGLVSRALRLERKLLPKGFRKLFVAALGPLGLLWLMTDTFRMFGKWLSRQPLEDIREWVADATEAVNFCKLAAYEYDVAVHVVLPALDKIVSAQDWYCTLGKDTLPTAVVGHPGYLEAWEPSATPRGTHPLVSGRLAPELPLPQRQIV